MCVSQSVPKTQSLQVLVIVKWRHGRQLKTNAENFPTIFHQQQQQTNFQQDLTSTQEWQLYSQSRGPEGHHVARANEALRDVPGKRTCSSREKLVVICWKQLAVPFISIIILLLVTRSHTCTRHRVTLNGTAHWAMWISVCVLTSNQPTIFHEHSFPWHQGKRSRIVKLSSSASRPIYMSSMVDSGWWFVW